MRWLACTFLSVVLALFLPFPLMAEEDSSCIDCHEGPTKTFEESVHGRAVLGASPRRTVDCMSCHKDHGKENFKTSNTPVIRGNDIKTCGDCHQTERKIYYRTFHGKHVALGKKNIPTCAFCHADHELPQTEALSPINPANVGRICANCHGKTDEDKVTMAATLSTPATGRILYFKDTLASSMINGLMGMLFVAVFALGLLFVTQWVRNLRGEPLPEKSGWPRGLWIQLAFFIVFFFIQEQTGATLFYASPSDGLLAYPMQKMGEFVMSIVATADMRSLIHRLGAIGLIVTVAVHIFYLAYNPALRQRIRLPHKWWRSLVLEMKQGLTPGGPASAVKGQLLYWILVVGAAVMVVTGIALWAAFWLMEWVGLWAVRYTDVIHGWTGRILVMAVYAILIGYGVILRPIAQKVQARKRNTNTGGL